jgi:Raf kinase inhibitor-like YbhB/YbcL family protein
MKSKSIRRFAVIASVSVLVLAIQLGGGANLSGKADPQWGWGEPFVLTSTNFQNGGTLPLSMALNSSGCAPNGAIGGDQSPEMSWTRPDPRTRSFVVTMFDSTASFTHWGMYNISPDRKGLPQGAGVAGSSYGPQVENDFYYGEQYDGPCPPTAYTPTTHEYVLTVYALDIELDVPAGTADFPPAGELLYNKLIDAGQHGHILQSASIQGTFSAVSNDAN